MVYGFYVLGIVIALLILVQPSKNMSATLLDTSANTLFTPSRATMGPTQKLDRIIGLLSLGFVLMVMYFVLTV